MVLWTIPRMPSTKSSEFLAAQNNIVADCMQSVGIE